MDADAIACGRCGLALGQEAPAAERLTWVHERTPERDSWLCPACARLHLRDIEGKLPTEYW
ncbi:hypothetical protein [Sciscionella marina]|uniref:hypothetical protein n=1 Tax=Sciscionella marina TaxID=508770 RepID=UPI0003A102BF|nr:hypothetical protein [Sciscionella marina]